MFLVKISDFMKFVFLQNFRRFFYLDKDSIFLIFEKISVFSLPRYYGGEIAGRSKPFVLEFYRSLYG